MWQHPKIWVVKWSAKLRLDRKSFHSRTESSSKRDPPLPDLQLAKCSSKMKGYVDAVCADGTYAIDIYLIIRYMDIIWMSRLGLGSGDFGVTSCQINVSKLLLLWLHRPSVWVLLVELCQADLHDLVGHLWNHESTLSTRQVIWLTKTPWTFTFLIHSHQMSQPTSSVLTSFYLFQWLVVHVQSFSRLFLEVPLVVAPGGSWDNPFEEDQKGPSLTWANLQFFPPVGSSELENINDTFGASCQWIFGLLSLVESLHP